MSLHSVVTFFSMSWTCSESSRFTSQALCSFCSVILCDFWLLDKASFNRLIWPFKLLMLGIVKPSVSKTKQFAHIWTSGVFQLTWHCHIARVTGTYGEFSGWAFGIPLFEYTKIYVYGLFLLQLWKRATFSLVRSAHVWSYLEIVGGFFFQTLYVYPHVYLVLDKYNAKPRKPMKTKSLHPLWNSNSVGHFLNGDR